MTPFTKITPTRQEGYLGIKPDSGVEVKTDPYYTFVEMPCRPLTGPKGGERRVLKAGEPVLLEMAGTMEVKPRYHALVSVNDLLTDWGVVSYQPVRSEFDPRNVRVKFVPDQDLEVAETIGRLGWFVRIYCM